VLSDGEEASQCEHPLRKTVDASVNFVLYFMVRQVRAKRGHL